MEAVLNELNEVNAPAVVVTGFFFFLTSWLSVSVTSH